MLEKLTIRGFKSIDCLLDFSLHPVNVLIGASGVGKSNLIDAWMRTIEMSGCSGNLMPRAGA